MTHRLANIVQWLPVQRIPVIAMALVASGLMGAETSEPHDDRVVLRSVAERVIHDTTRRLIDLETGRFHEDSTALAPTPLIRIDSKFNAWFYQTWLLTDGMRRTAQALDEPAFRNYGERNLQFIQMHMPFFEKQHAAGIRMAPVGDGKLSPIGFYFEMSALWHTGLAPLVMEDYARSKDPQHEAYLRRVEKLLESSPRFEDGTFYRAGKGLMTDDAYMTVPFLLRKWRATGEKRWLDTAVAQVLGTRSRLTEKRSGLLRHLWDLKKRQPAGQLWGRGNGWMVLAQVELLDFLPKDDPRRNEVLAGFVKHMEGIRRCQDPAGGWHQVLDHPESWIETSCTGMFVYGLARGVNEGWLEPSFAAPARSGFAALKTKVTDDGDIADVCGSTDVGDLRYYLDRPRFKGDLHGFGSFLLAGAEIIRMNRKD
jgi:rhamnogalacturonyl hydrolase YesR